MEGFYQIYRISKLDRSDVEKHRKPMFFRDEYHLRSHCSQLELKDEHHFYYGDRLSTIQQIAMMEEGFVYV